MRERIRFLIAYFLFWTVYFVVARIIFLGYHIEDSKNLTLETVFGIFKNGIKMDFSMAGYLCLVPFLMVSLGNFINKRFFQNTIFSYTFFFLTVVTLIFIIDLEVYNIWSFRLDATPLSYLKNPKEAWASVANSPVFPLLLSTIILVAVASNIIYRIIANKIYDWKVLNNFPFLIYGLLLTAALIIPIRGGFGIAPMNHSSVYFSENHFANISALNSPWNFFSSIIKRKSNKVNPFTFYPKKIVTENISELYKRSGQYQNVFKDGLSKPNVIFIVWESLSSKALGLSHKGVEVLPTLNKLKDNSIYFSNIYSSGDRTDKAIPAILSGYPAQGNESIIKDPVKSASLPQLSRTFAEAGYNTSFYYGGDTEFANIKSYLFNGQYEQIIESDAFPENLNNSKWGVHDEHLFNKYLEDLSKKNTNPFFSTLLTLSSHEPFETTRPKKIEGTETVDQYLNSLNYTDQVLGEFLEKARKSLWWDNTIVVILGDHGHKFPISKNKQDDFRIPLFFTGGAVKENVIINKLGSQIDLAGTLLPQLKLNAYSYNFSKNILDPKTPTWAFFSFNNGFGFLKDNDQLIFDNIGKKAIEKSANLNKKIELQGKVLQQRFFQDYLER